MAKLLIVLLIGLTFESTGVVLLKKGMEEIGDMGKVSVASITRTAKAALTNGRILLGVFFEALFFICLVGLMSKTEISFLWPLTGLSFVFATLAAMWFLEERVSPLRWAGVVLIMLGAALISYSQHSKPKPAPIDSPTQQAQR